LIDPLIGRSIEAEQAGPPDTEPQDGVLWATVSEQLRVTPGEIRDYFDVFAKLPNLKVRYRNDQLALLGWLAGRSVGRSVDRWNDVLLGPAVVAAAAISSRTVALSP
jgi:hypothetical protein